VSKVPALPSIGGETGVGAGLLPDDDRPTPRPMPTAVTATPAATPTQMGQRRAWRGGGAVGVAVKSAAFAAEPGAVADGLDCAAVADGSAAAAGAVSDEDDDPALGANEPDEDASIGADAVGASLGAGSSAGARPPSCTIMARTCARSGASGRSAR
jgi:hypothetical protein